MKIGGLQKLTLVDYPNKVAATVFLTGCNFKCGFCHNVGLVDAEEIKKQPEISEKYFFEFLDSKVGLIDGICITGGEPTINPDLIEFIKKIKAKGFLVKLDTNGSNPEMLEKIIQEKLVDFIAMDIKTSPDKYEMAINSKIDLEKISRSVDLIKNSEIDYEFRTTVVPGVVEEEDMEKMGKWLKGAEKFVIQQFRNQKVLDGSFEKVQPYSEESLRRDKKKLEMHLPRVELRL